MTEQKKRLPWRCKSPKQAKDKAEIYNSREWKQLRAAKLKQTPYCEKCRADGLAAGVKPYGYVQAAHCVHHIMPIETATTKEEMKRLALDCGLNGLMSLCDECHHKIHEEMKSFSKESVKARADARQERWADNIVNKFINSKTEDNEELQHQNVGGLPPQGERPTGEVCGCDTTTD